MTAALPAAGRSETLLLAGPAGAIEALVAVPREPALGIAVVCHPHPLGGGAMTNKVAYTLASAAAKSGLAALRFNFRGVGRSAGTHDGGRGETDDAVVVAEWLRGQLPDRPLLLAGFSFGAFVSLKAAGRLAPQALISIAPPFKYFDGEPPPPRPACPWLVVHSRDDDVVPYEGTREALQQYRPAPELVTVDGAGHFFHGRLGELDRIVSEFIKRHWPGA